MNNLYILWVVIPFVVLAMILGYFSTIYLLSGIGRRFPSTTNPGEETSSPTFTSFMLISMGIIFIWILTSISANAQELIDTTKLEQRLQDLEDRISKLENPDDVINPIPSPEPDPIPNQPHWEFVSQSPHKVLAFSCDYPDIDSFRPLMERPHYIDPYWGNTIFYDPEKKAARFLIRKGQLSIPTGAQFRPHFAPITDDIVSVQWEAFYSQETGAHGGKHCQPMAYSVGGDPRALEFNATNVGEPGSYKVAHYMRHYVNPTEIGAPSDGDHLGIFVGNRLNVQPAPGLYLDRFRLTKEDIEKSVLVDTGVWNRYTVSWDLSQNPARVKMWVNDKIVISDPSDVTKGYILEPSPDNRGVDHIWVPEFNNSTGAAPTDINQWVRNIVVWKGAHIPRGSLEPDPLPSLPSKSNERWAELTKLPNCIASWSLREIGQLKELSNQSPRPRPDLCEYDRKIDGSKITMPLLVNDLPNRIVMLRWKPDWKPGKTFVVEYETMISKAMREKITIPGENGRATNGFKYVNLCRPRDEITIEHRTNFTASESATMFDLRSYVSPLDGLTDRAQPISHDRDDPSYVGPLRSSNYERHTGPDSSWGYRDRPPKPHPECFQIRDDIWVRITTELTVLEEGTRVRIWLADEETGAKLVISNPVDASKGFLLDLHEAITSIYLELDTSQQTTYPEPGIPGRWVGFRNIVVLEDMNGDDL